MISGARKSKDNSSIKKSKKDYYLMTINHKPEGICTSHENAIICLEKYAEEYMAKKISDEIYFYDDIAGRHYMLIEPIKRIKVPGCLEME